tara:strand:- start:99 stop:554 length:456 start_codon:yes stop_codon:yes gene_type:complete
VKITVCAIGRLKAGPERDLWERYSIRLRCPLKIIELEARKKVSAAVLKRLEGTLLTDAIPAGTLVVALDERGKSFSSSAFANQLTSWNDMGRNLTFLIGGSNGIDQSILDNAHLTMSFGTATWPHMLARILLIEQLYRAEQILTGTPYHRD